MLSTLHEAHASHTVEELTKVIRDSDTWSIDKVIFAVLSPIHSGDKVEFNTVDFAENRLLPKPATNRQQSRLSPYTVDFVAGFANISATTWIRQLVAVDIVANSVDFVARMSNLLSTLSPVRTGPKQHGRFRRLSTKSTVLNSTLSPVCTGL